MKPTYLKHFVKYTAAFAAYALSAGLALSQQQGTTPDPKQNSSNRVFQVPSSDVRFLSGDSWKQGTQKFRLFGVQSCIRGTYYTDNGGQKQDCGTVSLSVFAAIVRDTKPACSPVAQVKSDRLGEPATILVVCSARIGKEAPDLGTILIRQGFAFAAFSNDAKPVYIPYAVAEAAAKQEKIGLWAFSDMPHPNSVLFRETK